jgi:membrane protease subunit HflK
MYLDVMQQIFSNTTKVMVDSKSGNNLIYLPLDKLIAQAAVEAGRQPAAPAASSAPPAAPADSLAVEPQRQKDTRDSRDARSRDGRDSRDREMR